MKRRSWLAIAVLAVLGLGLVLRAPLPYFVEQPGTLIGLAPRVQIQGYDDKLNGEVMFGTVNVRTATLWSAIGAGFDPHAQVIRRERLIPQGQGSAAFFAQQRAEFTLSSHLAAAVGMRAAGLPVDPDVLHGEGALVLRVQSGGPAEGRLQAGDVILRLNQQRVHTEPEFTTALTQAQWDPLTFTVQRDTRRLTVHVAPAADRTGEPSIGVFVSTFRPRVALPAPIQVDVDRVGGPSAGLAIALTVFDVVASEDLVAGRTIVVTGSIDPDGTVGPIGGIALKAVAAARAGVDRLLVPMAQLAEAQEAAGPDLSIVGVRTFDDAVTALRTKTRRHAASRSLYTGKRSLPARPESRSHSLPILGVVRRG